MKKKNLIGRKFSRRQFDWLGVQFCSVRDCFSLVAAAKVDSGCEDVCFESIQDDFVVLVVVQQD